MFRTPLSNILLSEGTRLKKHTDKMLLAIREGSFSDVKALDRNAPTNSQDSFFLCSAIFREQRDCIDYFLDKGVDVHASVESYDAKGKKGDAVLWTAYDKLRRIAQSEPGSAEWNKAPNMNGYKEEDRQYYTNVLARILACEPDCNAWLSTDARRIAASFENKTRSFQLPSKDCALNEGKIPKHLLRREASHSSLNND